MGIRASRANISCPSTGEDQAGAGSVPQGLQQLRLCGGGCNVPVCGFANLFPSLQNNVVQSTEVQSWRVYYSRWWGKNLKSKIQLKSVLYGSPPALQPAPSAACLQTVETDKFPELPALRLRESQTKINLM